MHKPELLDSDTYRAGWLDGMQTALDLATRLADGADGLFVSDSAWNMLAVLITDIQATVLPHD